MTPWWPRSPNGIGIGGILQETSSGGSWGDGSPKEAEEEQCLSYKRTRPRMDQPAAHREEPRRPSVRHGSARFRRVSRLLLGVGGRSKPEIGSSQDSSCQVTTFEFPRSQKERTLESVTFLQSQFAGPRSLRRTILKACALLRVCRPAEENCVPSV
jgi:hypothetical protein